MDRLEGGLLWRYLGRCTQTETKATRKKDNSGEKLENQLDFIFLIKVILDTFIGLLKTTGKTSGIIFMGIIRD